MTFLEEMVREYGYWAIFVGTLFEGETIYLLGAFAASQGWLKIEYVFVAGFTGTFLSDQTVFLLARRYGPGLVARYPGLKRRVDRVTPYLERWDTWFILGFRFVYGVRNLAAIAIALTNIAPARFFWLNLIAALVWAIGFAAIGYLFGVAAKEFLGDIKHIEVQILVGIALILVVWALGRFIFKRLNSNRRPNP